MCNFFPRGGVLVKEGVFLGRNFRIASGSMPSCEFLFVHGAMVRPMAMPTISSPSPKLGR